MPEADPTPVVPALPPSCCPARKKIVIGILTVLPEDVCGVPDSALADFIRWDLSAPGAEQKPVIQIAHCPWCGSRIDPAAQVVHFSAIVEEAEPAPGEWTPEADLDDAEDPDDD